MAVPDHTEDVPLDILRLLCMMPDYLRHWTSECQDKALANCRVEILRSLPMPEGDKPAHIFTREVSLLIPQLLRDTPEPERVWTSNFNTRLCQLLFSRLPATLRKIGITAARSGMRTALETLAKGCHKLWVARHEAMTKAKVNHQDPVDVSDGDSVDSLSSWHDEDGVEMSQTLSVDDEMTQIQEDDMEGNGILEEDEQADSVVSEAAPQPHTKKTRVPNKERKNADYF